MKNDFKKRVITKNGKENFNSNFKILKKKKIEMRMNHPGLHL